MKCEALNMFRKGVQIKTMLRVVEWIALIRFLFGICGIINQH